MKKKEMKTLKLNKRLITDSLNGIVGGVDKRKIKIPCGESGSCNATVNTDCCANTVDDGSCGCGIA